MLVSSLLATTTLAAPRFVAAETSRASADAAHWVRTRLWPALGGLNRPSRPEQEKQSERNALVKRIEVSPRNVTIQTDEHVMFAATALTAKGESVSGVRFTWRARNVQRGQASRISPTGEFVSLVPGEFQVTAEALGMQASVHVKVVSDTDDPRSFRKRPRPNEKPLSVKQVSTRDEPAEVASAAKKKSGSRASNKARRSSSGVSFVKASYTPAAAAEPVEPAAPASPEPAAYLINGETWDNTNYMYADDPGTTRGDPPGMPADGGAGSGNYQAGAPVLELPGRGIALKLNLTYNSQVWTKTGSQITFDIDQDWPAPGWSLGFGRLIQMGSSGSMLVDSDGTRHSYTGTLNSYSWGSYFTGYTTDSTFIDYTHSANSSGVITWASARFPNGTIVDYGAPGRNAVYPTRITDPNGNYITITYRNNAGPNIETVTDTLGRVVNFHYDPNGLLTAVTAPNLGGGTRTLVRLNYRWVTLSYWFYGLTPHVRSQTVPVVNAIYYPATRTGFWFGDGDSYSTYGMIAKFAEQRSMNFSAASLNDNGSASPGAMASQKVYNYPMDTGAGYLTAAPTYTTMTETWAGMDTAPAVTTFSVQQNSSPRTVSITQPDGTRSVQYSYNAPNTWYDGLVYQDELYDSSNQLWRRSTVSWQQGAYGSVRPVRNETMDERGQVTADEFIYGPHYNQVTELRSYGYGGYQLLRKTVSEYENGSPYINRHIFSLVKSVTVYDADEVTRLSRTEYQYDGPGTSLQHTPDVIMHDSSYDPYAPQYWVEGPCYYNCDDYYYGCYYTCDPGYWQTDYNPATDYRGNVTQVVKYANASNLTGAVVETRAYDETGNLVRTSSSCCEEQRATYGVATQYAFAASESRGSSDPNSPVRVTTHSTYDYSTGLPLSSTDANGRVSHMSYFADSLRPQTAARPSGSYTTFAYDDDQGLVTETVFRAGGAVASSNVKRFNGRGQVQQESSLAPGGVYDIVETKYDQLGHIWKQSRPFRSGNTPQWTETFYDPLGRATKAVGPDGSIAETFYSEASRPPGASADPGLTKRTVDAWGRQRWERADASGRVVEVAEPDPSGSGSVFDAGALLTRYRYDGLGNLAEVTQEAQRRAFRHDSLGRMTHQKLAEAAATLNDAGQYVGSGQWSHVFFYDDRSNLVTQVDARGVRTNYAYSNDPLNRLQSISYDTSGVGDASSPIEAAATITYHYVTTGDLTRLSQVTANGVSTESYTYDSEGRPNSKTQTLASRPGYPMTVEYTYDSLDKLTDVRYPTQYGAGGATKYLHYDYDSANRISAVKVNGVEYGSQITYGAESQITSMTVGAPGANQTQEAYGFNAQTGLLENQTVTRNGTQLLNLSYDYFGSGTRAGRTGQLKKITNNLNADKSRGFEYDALGRLLRATGGQNVNWVERYAYDRYGNRQNVFSYSGEQYVRNFYQVTLLRQPSAGELQYWMSQLQAAYAQGQSQFLSTMSSLGDSLFNSADYAARNRSNSDYVYDLYKSYLFRDPDQGGWDFWTNGVAYNGRAAVRAGFTGSHEFYLKMAGTSPYAPPSGIAVPRDGLEALGYDQASNRVNWPGWAYDAAGNQIRAQRSDGVWQRFVYDAAGRMVRVKDDYGNTIARHKYGNTTQRLETQAGGDYSNSRTYYVWDGNSVITEYAESDASPSAPIWRKNYVFLQDRLLATQESSGGGESVTFHHPDHQGTRLVTNQAAGTSFEQATLPFGTALNAESSGGTNRRFTSYDRNLSTALDYALNRHYDPSQGRFTQVDPIGMKASNLSDPQTLNLYAYCGNDPVNNVDPDGLFFGKLFKGIGKLFKGIAKFFGKVSKVIGKVVSFVASVMSKILHNRWVMIGVAIFSFFFPPAWAIYKALSEFTSILQITGLLLQGRWKELAFTAIQAAIQWAINKAISFALEKLQNAIGGRLFGVNLTRLSACAQAMLQPFFPGINLAKLKIYTGLKWVFGRDAFTFGSNQYYREGQLDGSATGLGLAAHETVHTQQFRRHGTYVFGIRYLIGLMRHGPDNNSFEVEAYRIGDSIRDALKAQHGNTPCATATGN